MCPVSWILFEIFQSKGIWKYLSKIIKTTLILIMAEVGRMMNGSPDPCSDADDHSAVFMANGLL